MKTARLFTIALTLLGATLLAAQAAPAPTLTSLPNNIYAIGPTYNPNGSPMFSGTMLYGRLTDGAKGTYAIGVFDVTPGTNTVTTTDATGATTTKTYSVITNTTSAGIAQQFYNNGRVKVFVTPSAGLSYTSTNTGYSYALGGLVTYDLSPNYAIGFGGRAFKSNVSGAGYQPALSFEFILKQ